ncbi:iron-sulfur cluster biosynthesis transcriptional regulator SufR [Nostoc piscinale]|uniref:iron-sulfur cluster biosynthesis transcriptional regulator SufR n=1 Tax=Nostoc piscinale TaxID=224012 RepID=UPI0039A7319E
MATTQQSSTKQEILEYLLKHSQATAFELSDVLNVSPQAIRRHLKDLEAEELIVYASTTQAGMGRPQHIYQLSRQGRDRLHRTTSDRFGDGYGEFAVSLLDTLAETVGHDKMKTILQKQWERKAQEYRDRVGQGSLKERVETLVQLRKAEGFMAEYHSVEVNDDHPTDRVGDRFVLIEHNCAISNVAESFPTVCGHELEMFAAVLPDCIVERTHWIINGEHRCGYLVQARKPEQN